MINLKESISAIIEHILKNPNIIKDELKKDVDIESTKDPKNWKRLLKEPCDKCYQHFYKVPDAKNLQIFDCQGYDDHLRALVFDDNEKIILIEIIGE